VIEPRRTVAGTGLNAPPEFRQQMPACLQALANLEVFPAENLFERKQSLADVVDFSSSLRTLAVILTRIANDFRLMSSGPATGLERFACQPYSLAPVSCQARSIR
jgi:fumarate hydratase, class II